MLPALDQDDSGDAFDFEESALLVGVAVSKPRLPLLDDAFDDLLSSLHIGKQGFLKVRLCSVTVRTPCLVALT